MHSNTLFQKTYRLSDDAGIDLLDYVMQNHELEKHGFEYAMHCPLHVDKTPSLMINPTKNRWYCHSCHNGGDLLWWLIKIEHMPYDDAVNKLREMAGGEIKQLDMASSLRFFTTVASILNENSESPHREVLPQEYLDTFQVIDGEPHEWIEEGIPVEMLRKYNIRIDVHGNRIVYPVYDNDGNLIGVKGRTRYENYKTLGIKKYINYQKIGTTDYFQGMKENSDEILSRNEIIVVEGLKSVMKIDGFGYGNVVAAETSMINDAQVKILVGLDIRDVVLAFDNDVSYQSALVSANKIKRWVNTYVIYDKNKILGSVEDKLSPCDKGKEIWEILYNERKRIL